MSRTAHEPPQDGGGSPVSGAVVFEAAVVAEAHQISAVRARLQRWLAKQPVEAGLTMDVILCASEAMTNSVEHAYRDVERGEMTIRVEVDAEGLTLTVTDHGTWRAPDDQVGTCHGWGLPLIRSLASRLDIEREQGRTRVSARFLR